FRRLLFVCFVCFVVCFDSPCCLSFLPVDFQLQTVPPRRRKGTHMKRLAIGFAIILGFLLPGRGQEATSLVPQFLKTLKPRSIGPANMSGRIVDLAVHEQRPSIMYVASASGGLWKTVNNGITFHPVFERESTVALGAVALAQSNP